MKIYFALLILFVSPCYANHNVYLSDDKIYYQGELNLNKNNKVKQLLEQRRLNISALIITSPGGTIEDGIELGSLVFQYKLDVEVKHFCHSSCANYVFTAGQNKFIDSYLDVIWHGGSLQPLVKKVYSSFELAQLKRFVGSCDIDFLIQQWVTELYYYNPKRIVKECQFFKQIGVNVLATVYGQFFFNNTFVSTWSYSIDALEDLGIEGVNVKDPSTVISRKDFRLYSAVPYLNNHGHPSLNINL